MIHRVDFEKARPPLGANPSRRAGGAEAATNRFVFQLEKFQPAIARGASKLWARRGGRQRVAVSNL